MDEEKNSKIIFADKGQVFVMNFKNQYEAMGATEAWCHPDRMKKLMDDQIAAAHKYIPILGEISVEDGGEYYIQGFHNPLEALGFITAYMNPNALLKLINSMGTVPPQTFKQMQQIAKDRHGKRREAIDKAYEKMYSRRAKLEGCNDGGS